MALVSKSKPSHPDLRIYEPNFATWHPKPEEDSESRSHLLRNIRSFYRKARKRLRRGAHGLCVGLCVGLLDPVSNIVVNSLIELKWKREVRREGNHKSTSTCDVVPQDDLERRSLDGLVVFLTRLFPNLSEGLAVRYLRLAKADVLVAACIVVSDHGIKSFDVWGADDINMALRCAGLAARHPDPYRLVYSWCNISSSIDEALTFLEVLRTQPSYRGFARLECVDMISYKLPDREKDVWSAWQLAEASVRRHPRSVPQLHTHLLNRTLQDTIHGYYLQALARLPAGSRLHRSLIRAGHCYGPLDPVSNIIINTIWHDATFPTKMKLELDVIGTWSLHRVENRSLYGLASFLCTRYHCFDFHQAVRCLLKADANLVLADPNLHLDHPSLVATFGIGGGVLRGGPAATPLCEIQIEDPPDTGIEEAFLAAATAACHPNPEDQVELLASCKAMLGSALSLLHPDYGKLSSEDVQLLGRLLSSKPHYEYKRALPPVPLKCYPRAELADLYTVISKEVIAMLKKYEKMPNGDPKFELHTICGVNDRVCGPALWPPHDHGHSHVNFVAISNSTGGGVPTLFFAEINDDDTDNSFCCRVALPPPCAAQIRCIYCESMGTRIVHPAGIQFRGRQLEFEKMAREKDPLQRVYATLRINYHRSTMAESIHVNVKEDSLYDGVDGHKSEYDVDKGSMSVEQAMLLVPACGCL